MRSPSCLQRGRPDGYSRSPLPPRAILTSRVWIREQPTRLSCSASAPSASCFLGVTLAIVNVKVPPDEPICSRSSGMTQTGVAAGAALILWTKPNARCWEVAIASTSLRLICIRQCSANFLETITEVELTSPSSSSGQDGTGILHRNATSASDRVLDCCTSIPAIVVTSLESGSKSASTWRQRVDEPMVGHSCVSGEGRYRKACGAVEEDGAAEAETGRATMGLPVPTLGRILSVDTGADGRPRSTVRRSTVPGPRGVDDSAAARTERAPCGSGEDSALPLQARI